MTEECKEAYWNSVYDLLHASNAVNESTALLLSFVGARCHKPNALRATKATQCLRESGMFHIAEFPATGRDRIWLLPQRTKPNVHVKVKAQVAPKVKASATVTPPAMATKPLPAVLCDTTTSSCMAPGGSHEEFYWRTVYMILDSKRAIGQDNAVPLELILGNHGNPNAVQSLQESGIFRIADDRIWITDDTSVPEQPPPPPPVAVSRPPDMRFKVVRAASNVPPVPEGGVLRASDMFDDIVPTAAREYKKAVARIAANVKTLCNEGIIEGALIPGDVADSLEFYGDAVLHLKITRTLRSMYGGLYGPGGLHQARMSAEQRHTLAKLYDDMNLGDILPARSVECMARDEWKLKGDFIEALVGELESKLDDAHGVHRDHPHRELVIEVIDRIVKALILNGQYLRSSDIRKAMIKKASRLE